MRKRIRGRSWQRCPAARAAPRGAPAHRLEVRCRIENKASQARIDGRRVGLLPHACRRRARRLWTRFKAAADRITASRRSTADLDSRARRERQAQRALCIPRRVAAVSNDWKGTGEGHQRRCWRATGRPSVQRPDQNRRCSVLPLYACDKFFERRAPSSPSRIRSAPRTPRKEGRAVPAGRGAGW